MGKLETALASNTVPSAGAVLLGATIDTVSVNPATRITTFTTRAWPTVNVRGSLVVAEKPVRSACTMYTPSGISGAE